MRIRGLAAAMLVLIAIAATGAAAAENASAADKAIAKQAFEEGTRRYNLGEYEAALTAFKNAYLHYEEPAFLFNIAQCQRALGRKTEALQLYRSFLRLTPTAPEGLRKNVSEIIAQLEAAIAAEQKADEERRAAAAQAAAAAAAPPEGTIGVVQEAPPRKTPIYKKWWLWTAVGGVVVVGVAVGLAVGLSRTPTAPNAPAGFQTIQPAF